MLHMAPRPNNNNNRNSPEKAIFKEMEGIVRFADARNIKKTNNKLTLKPQDKRSILVRIATLLKHVIKYAMIAGAGGALVALYMSNPMLVENVRGVLRVATTSATAHAATRVGKARAFLGGFKTTAAMGVKRAFDMLFPPKSKALVVYKQNNGFTSHGVTYVPLMSSRRNSRALTARRN